MDDCKLCYTVAFATIVPVFYYLFKKFNTHAMCTTNTKLDGKTVIITGANTGIGKETAIDLARRGATVVMACRDLNRGEKALEEVKNLSGSQKIFLRILDLASLKSINNFSSNFIKEFDELHILINNAGVMMCPHWKTEDGFEMQFGVNHLGHFALTNLLLKHMIKTKGRVINVSSMVYAFGDINFDDINSEKSYNKIKAYSQSKLANILFTRELQNKLGNSNITTYSLHPGAIKSDLQRHVFYLQFLPRFLGVKNAIEGAQTTIYCATKEGLEEHAGKYFKECQVTTCCHKAFNDLTQLKKLWEISEKLTGVAYPL
ncbi:retinol dehydrogenase 12 [Hydra vulgaris]|uniref:Retinol dehydrogenase 12 n=1 Tax=Hydra vulgaris TaxID=6087 RepID=A0ABM4CNV7_HYDVU